MCSRRRQKAATADEGGSGRQVRRSLMSRKSAPGRAYRMPARNALVEMTVRMKLLVERGPYRGPRAIGQRDDDDRPSVGGGSNCARNLMQASGVPYRYPVSDAARWPVGDERGSVRGRRVFFIGNAADSVAPEARAGHRGAVHLALA